MKTVWKDKVYDVRECRVYPFQVSEGDWIAVTFPKTRLQGYVRVVVIQRDCPRLEKLSILFTQFTCVTEEGTIYPLRSSDFPERVTVLKQNTRHLVVRSA